MADANLSTLIQRHQMGLAYKAITAAMGPSPQLVAFVNYDQVDNGNFGLESFDIVGQHEAILEQIESDNSLKLGLEGFLSGLFKGPLPSYHQFQEYQHFSAVNRKYIESTLNKVPKNLTLKSWEEFDYHAHHTETTFFEELQKGLGEIKSTQKEDNSGWTTANYEAAVKWTDAAIKQSDGTVKLHKAKIDEIKALLNSPAADKAKDIAKIRSIADKRTKLFIGMDHEGAGSAHQAKDLLSKVEGKIKDK